MTPDEANFRHSGWAVQRHRVHESLERLHVSENRIDRFCQCGSGMYLQVAEAGDDVKIVCNCCNDRWCVPCATKRATLIRESIARALDGKFTRFVTLTLRHSQTPLSDQINRLYRSFSTLRRRAFWKGCVTGGAAVCELKLGEKDGLWHVHLHIVCEGKFIDQRELSREWHAVTGDSSIVDVRRTTDPEQQASYLCKYITKPADRSVFNLPAKLDEIILALKGRRLCTTFGKWRGIKLEEVPECPGKWITVARLDTLQSQVDAGSEEAKRWQYVAARRWPLLAEMFQWRLDPPPE